MTQRMLTTRTAMRGGGAMVASTLLSIPVICLFLFIGLLLSIYYGRPDLMGAAAPTDLIVESRRIYPQYLLSHLPPVVKGLAMAGLFAAAMSSFDSAITAMASSAVGDLYVPFRNYFRRRGTVGAGLPADSESLKAAHPAEGIWISRAAVVLMSLLLIGFAILAVFIMDREKESSTLVDFALGVMAFANGPLLGVFSAAIFTRRGNVISVLAALAAGFLTVLLLQPYMAQKWLQFDLAWPWWTVIASFVSFCVCFAGRPAARDQGEVQA
jgi:Na+/proline symporter